MQKVIIVDRVLPFLSEQLEKNGYECVTNKQLTYEDFIGLPDEFDGLIIRSRFKVDHNIIDSKSKLKFIVRIGSGVENIDTEYAKSRGIKCISTPEGNANAVAELCLSFLMSALRHLSTANQEVRQGEWLREKNKGTELASHTVGIIGYGHTGPAFARILSLLGCKVLCYDRYKFNYGDEYATEATLEQIQNQCDIISFHINYTPENHYLFNKEFIDRMNHPFIVLNTSRGLVVNTADTISALKSEKILFACFDVLEFESTRLQIPAKSEWPATLQKLSEMENVILTPHVGGQTHESERRHAEIAVKRILQL